VHSPIIHYYHVLLPLVSAIDLSVRSQLEDSLKEIDYLIETLCYSELTPEEQVETELAYWAWWEKIRNRVCA
jgi:hypothetical protein